MRLPKTKPPCYNRRDVLPEGMQKQDIPTFAKGGNLLGTNVSKVKNKNRNFFRRYAGNVPGRGETNHRASPCSDSAINIKPFAVYWRRFPRKAMRHFP